MIYVVTNGNEIRPDNAYDFCDMQYVIDYLTALQEICLDAETQGFDPHTKKLISLQVGDEHNQFVIDCKTVDIMLLKSILESRLVVAQNCLPGDTEVLTSVGWKNIKHVCLSDIIYGYKDGKIVKQSINALIKNRGVIWNIHGKSRSLRSTPEHRWLFEERDSGIVSYKTSEEILKSRGKIILNGKYINDNKTEKLTDDELRLFVWAITDGHITFGVKGAPGQIIITQSTSKMKFVEEIQAVVERLNLPTWACKKVPMKGYSDCRRWFIPAKSAQELLAKISYTKKFNYCEFVLGLTDKQLDIFIDTFNKAEGCESCEGDYTIGQSLSVNPTKRDAIALALYLRGYTLGFTKDIVSAKASNFMDSRTCQLQVEEKQDVYCLNTELGSFVVRQNEQIFLTGNCKFDMKFLFSAGIILNKIYDTFVVERVLNCGLDYVRAGLEHLTERYAGVILDKSVRVDIPKEGLSPRVIRYGAKDIEHLPIIKRKQLEKAKDQELTSAINLENRFTPCLAYIEWCGFKLDAAKWKEKMNKDQIHLSECEKKLNDWVINNEMDEYIDQQLDMFTPQGCTINWSSPKQVIEIFEELGIKCEVIKKGQVKKSVEASVIAKYAEEKEIVRLYLEYKKADKVVSTYGENFLAHINPVTGRIHTNFKQVLDTGRISSGGRDSDRGVNLINFQNIPADPETRSCFVAESGHKLICYDYSGQEQIVLANYSMDPGLLKFYDEGLGDMHSYVASLMFPEIQEVPLEEIKSKHKDKRQKAKTAGFAINYGGNGNTISENQNISVEEGEQIYNAYFNAFPGLKAHFDSAKQQGLSDGYIMISPITKRKSYIMFFEKYQDLDSQMTNEFWTKYRKMKGEYDRAKKAGNFYDQYDEFREMRFKVREYFNHKGIIERKSLNFPIQGSSAEITKTSCIYIFDWILKNNYFGIVKFCNTVHDENVLETPDDLAQPVAEIVDESMIKSGKFFCKRVPLKVSGEITQFWKK